MSVIAALMFFFAFGTFAISMAGSHHFSYDSPGLFFFGIGIIFNLPVFLSAIVYAIKRVRIFSYLLRFFSFAYLLFIVFSVYRFIDSDMLGVLEVVFCSLYVLGIISLLFLSKVDRS